MPVPVPFDLAKFCGVISHRRGRPLTLVPKETSLGPCGIWLALPDADFVFYEPDTSQLHRDHIILHELGHLLCQHEPRESIDDEVLAELFPNLSPETVRKVLGRTTYSAVEEQEAEMMAALLQERIGRDVVPDGVGSDPNAVVVGRLQNTLGGRRRHSLG